MSTIRLKMTMKAPKRTILNQLVVGLADGGGELGADSGNVEDGLGEDRVAGQEHPDVEPQQRDDRGQALRIPCRITTVRSVRPLARAVRM